MKLYETDANNFNDYSSAEPDASIFQTSYWSDYMVSKGYKASFIEASDEHDTCLALSSLLLKKESFLSSKYTALAPHGFLINYYDEELFKTFHGLMSDYLKQERVSKLFIEPQVDKDNRMAEQMLEKLGYRKESDITVYEVDTAAHVNDLSDPNVILKVRVVKDDSVFRKLASSKEEKEDLKIFEYLKDHAAVYIASIDTVKSIRAIGESMAQNDAFIKEHRSDYKFVEQVNEKDNENSRLKKLQAAIENYSADPDIAAYCVSDFSDKCTVLFKMNIDKEDLFKAEKIIVDQICADCLNRGIIKVDSEENFAYAVPRQLLGRYSLKI